MRLSLALSVLLSFFLSPAAGAESQKSIDIFAWPLSASKSQTFASISYNTTTATLKSHSRPSIPEIDEIVRIGFHHSSTGKWSGIATSASNFAEGKDQKLQLLLNSEGEVYHVGFKAEDASKASSGSGKESKKDGLSVEVVPMNAGPQVHLNKPVVVNPDGKVGGEEEQKSFLQKYGLLLVRCHGVWLLIVFLQILVGYRALPAVSAFHGWWRKVVKLQIHTFYRRLSSPAFKHRICAKILTHSQP